MSIYINYEQEVWLKKFHEYWTERTEMAQKKKIILI